MEKSESKQPDSEVLNVIEAALMTAQKPLGVRLLARLFSRGAYERQSLESIRAAVEELARSYASRGVELVEVAGGFRIQARSHYADPLARLWEEKPPRYSRALLETLAIIAYRQPVTRGDIESIRGITVNPGIIRTLTEREWVRVVGHREVPGRPELFATTREFLDYFGLKHLRELPPLPEPRTATEDKEHDINNTGDAENPAPIEDIVEEAAAGSARDEEAATPESELAPATATYSGPPGNPDTPGYAAGAEVDTTQE